MEKGHAITPSTHEADKDILVNEIVKKPSLTLVNGVEGTSPTAEWNNYTFEFSEQNVFGGVISTNSASRGRNLYNAIMDVAPDSLPEAAGQKYTDSLHSVQKRLDSKIIIEGESVATRSLIDVTSIADGLWSNLQTTNHPLVQAVRMVENENNRRVIYNAERSIGKLPTLTANEIAKLREDLLLAGFPETTRTELVAAAKMARNQLRQQKQGKTIVQLVEIQPDA